MSNETDNSYSKREQIARSRGRKAAAKRNKVPDTSGSQDTADQGTQITQTWAAYREAHRGDLPQLIGEVKTVVVVQFPIPRGQRVIDALIPKKSGTGAKRDRHRYVAVFEDKDGHTSALHIPAGVAADSGLVMGRRQFNKSFPQHKVLVGNADRSRPVK